MNEDMLKILINQYVEQQMKYVIPENTDTYKTSKKFRKRMKRLFWSEKYFGKQVRLGNVIRKVAIVAMIVGSVVIAGEVSAKIFGFRPWEFVINYLEDSRMEDKTYKKLRSNEGEYEQAKKEVPSYIPEGLKETDRQEEDIFLYVDWVRNEKCGVQYLRTRISNDLSVASDAEYTEKRKVDIAGYVAYFYKKGNERWLDWDDEKYTYQLFAIGLRKPEEELVKMAESIYW